MNDRRIETVVLWTEVIGFGLIIALSWAEELADLPRLLLGGEHQSHWRESIIETCTVVVVAIPVFMLTRRILARLLYLEEFLRVCAWCRKLNHNDEWVPVEEYFQRGFNKQTTHGICPECLDKATE